MAVSELLLLLLAKELQAAEFAPARTSLSLLPKTSFTATQVRDCARYFPERRALQQVSSMANKQNGNPNLMQFQSFPPLLRVEILSLHIRTIHLPCMTKITSCVIFSPRESLHVSLCIIPLLKYCEMDEFCRAKQVKLFISAFSL